MVWSEVGDIGQLRDCDRKFSRPAYVASDSCLPS